MDPWTKNLRQICSPMLKSFLASGLSLPWIWLVKLKKTSLHGRCVTQVILSLRVFNLRIGIIHTLHDLSADLSSLIRSWSDQAIRSINVNSESKIIFDRSRDHKMFLEVDNPLLDIDARVGIGQSVREPVIYVLAEFVR